MRVCVCFISPVIFGFNLYGQNGWERVCHVGCCRCSSVPVTASPQTSAGREAPAPQGLRLWVSTEVLAPLQDFFLAWLDLFF